MANRTTIIDKQALLIERQAVAATMATLTSIFNARQALAEEIADLNLIHDFCEEVRCLHELLRLKVIDLQKELENGQPRAQAPSSWQRLLSCLPLHQPIQTSQQTEDHLLKARDQLAACARQADQLTLEMISRQAFIADTTRKLLVRLSYYAPNFQEGRRRWQNAAERLQEIDSLLSAS